MSCSNKMKNCHYKSCQRYYNNNSQPFSANATIQLQIAGTRVVDTGVSIETEPQSFNTLKTGLYHISADAVVNATVEGSGTITVFMDGVALPCTVRTIVLAVGDNEIHTETDLLLSGCCCDVNHTFTITFTSVTAAGSIDMLCAGMVKMA